MKKLVLAALAIGAMAACTKSNVQYEQPGEISLQPVTQKATKAAIPSTSYPTSSSFNVWAWWGADKEDDIIVDYTYYKPYIEKGKFQYKDDNTWRGSPTAYYWPTTGYLVFAGYSPSDAVGEFAYDLNPAPQLTISEYKQTDGVDLMWFDVTTNSYNHERSTVPAEFKHALSWLDFKMKLKDGSPSNWVITKVELKEIHTEGKATIDKGSAPVWVEEGEHTTLMLYDNGETGYTVGSTTQTHPVIDALIIPQPATSVCITYNLKGTGDNVLKDQTVTLPLTAGTDDGDTWKPGKHYVYTITFGANEIFISPTVAPWGEEIEITIE